MVTPDNHMGAAIIAADQRVPQSLARTGHAHGQRQKIERGLAIGVMRQQRFIAAHAGVVIDIARLGHADDGMDQEIAANLFGGTQG